MKKRTLLLIVLWIGALAALLTPGCSKDEMDLAEQQIRELRATRNATTQAVEDEKQQLAKLSETDPQRAKLEKLVSDAEKALAKIEPALKSADAILKAKDVNDPTLDGLASSFGPWGMVALLGARLIFTEIDRRNKAKHVTQLVQSVANAFPALTEVQKAALAAKQDADLQVTVAKIKAAA